MGQKSHPIGLRLGIHRKWGTSWFALPATGRSATVSARGGIVRAGREDRVSTLLARLPFTFGQLHRGDRPLRAQPAGRSRRSGIRRAVASSRLFPVDLQVRPGIGGSLTVRLSYVNLRNRLP